MARKVVNRKELRAQAEAAEAQGKAKKEPTAKPKAAKKAKTAKTTDEAGKPKPAAKRPSRKKAVKEVRLKAFWGVLNQTMKRVAMFEYADKRAAQKKAAELGGQHFVQLVKEPITEA